MPDHPISGPCTFTEPPADLMGWLQLDSAREFELIAGTPADPFLEYKEYLKAFEKDRETPESKRIWDYIKQATGEHLRTWRQLTGDCVSHGCATSVETAQCAEIAKYHQEEVFRPVFRPYCYGISRCARDLGNGRLGGGAGSTGAWGAGSLRLYGTLFCDDKNVPAYSKAVAEKWGRMPGPPEWAREAAADNCMGKTVKLRSLEQVSHELINRRPVTMACMYDFEMRPREYKGYHVGRRGKTVGGHQGCLTEWMDDPFAGAYWQGSWGKDAHGTPMNGEQPGGFWIREADLDHHLNGNYSEFFAMSHFAGHPGPPDHGIL